MPATFHLHEFAQRVLYATTLEEKLAGPCVGARLIDDPRGAAIVGTTIPGRPADLRMRRDGVRANFPSKASLIDEEQRAVLMHFFANHELIAVELMALVLLKFPDAPKRFRLGVYQTLREEQMHARWYVNRMNECGVNFGDFPVSNLIWDQIAPMACPLDYVSRLSLTFEQANLDYSKFYAGVMHDAGDTKTAKILAQIYRDEINHVGYGLHWFRKWKEESRSDWDKFRSTLVFPLSPVRAKAVESVPFNAEGRRAAGLDEDFIDHLQVFEMSRGRTPDVFVFNPGCELDCLPGGAKSTPALNSLRRDLELLPLAFAKKDDVILVENQPSVQHLQTLRDAGFTLPEFITDLDELTTRRLRNLRPWGWSPTIVNQLTPWREHCTGHDETARSVSDPSAALSKRRTAGLRQRIAGAEATATTVCTSADEVAAEVKRLRENGHSSVVLKSEFGAAAHGNRCLFDDTPIDNASKWIAARFNEGQAILVEAWLPKVFEYSAHFDRRAAVNSRSTAKVTFRGFSRMKTNSRGQWQHSAAGAKFCRGLPPQLASHLQHKTGPLTRFQSEFPALLEALYHPHGYFGPIGIDAFVWKDPPSGQLRDQLVVEINARYTMGRAALELHHQLAKDKVLVFALEKTGTSPQWDSERTLLNSSALKTQWQASIYKMREWPALP